MNDVTFSNTLGEYKSRVKKGEATQEFNLEICNTIEDVKIAYVNEMLTDNQADYFLDEFWFLRNKVASAIFTD